MRLKLQLVLALPLLVISACTAGRSNTAGAPVDSEAGVHADDHSDGEHTHLDDTDLTAAVNVVMVPSEITLGPNRFAVGLLDEAGNLIQDARVHFHYYDLRDPDTAVYESDADARVVKSSDGYTAIYAHDRDFNHTGLWGVEIEIQLPDGTAAKKRLGFDVPEDTTSIAPGERVPMLNTPTLDDVGQTAALLTSAPEPNPALHKTSLAQALVSDKPTLLLFATPAYCETRFCGPAYETVGELESIYGQQVNFVYVEVFESPSDPSITSWRASPAAAAFGLESEPWVYLINESGLVVYRLEGLFTAAELEQQVQERLDL